MITQFVINDLVTWGGEKMLLVPSPTVCSKARDLFKIWSLWAGLPTDLEPRSAGDVALATVLTTGEGMVAMVSVLDTAASSKLPQWVAEASKPADELLYDNAFPVSANHRNSQTLRSSVRKNALSEADGEQLGNHANRRQFQGALLENCSFVAALMLRQVRTGGTPSRELLERDSSREKLNVVRVAPTPHGSKANVVAGQRPEEPAPAETPSFLLPPLWVEVGCRQVRILVSEKERP